MALIDINSLLLVENRLVLSLVCFLGLLISYTVALTMYRLYLHPLSAFPGPMLSGATGWYETYYDVYKRGKMVKKLEALHKRYGGSLPLPSMPNTS